jgi:uncharacterized repeat protein (TIGR01451 family)
VDIKVKVLPWEYFYTAGIYEDTYSIGNNPPMMVMAKNIGQDDATGVSVECILGSSLTFKGLDTRGMGTATYHNNNNTITYNPGNIPQGCAANMVIYLGTVTSGLKTPAQTTTASLIHVDQPDTNSSNDISSYALNIPKAADIQVNQTEKTNGGSVTYTITATNNGPDDATGLKITDLLPAGLTYSSHTISIDGGNTWGDTTTTYNNTTGIWDIGNFNYTLITKIIKITAEITTSGPIRNYAQWTSLDQYDWTWANDEQETIITI